jgi:hypothetical protein
MTVAQQIRFMAESFGLFGTDYSNYPYHTLRRTNAAAPPDQLVDQGESRDVAGLSLVETARMEREMETLSRDFKQIEESHGKNVLNLVIIVGYLKRLLDNARVVRYLALSYPRIQTNCRSLWKREAWYHPKQYNNRQEATWATNAPGKTNCRGSCC